MNKTKAVWSDIGENQTIAINAITDRITIRHRRWASGKAATEETKDVLVDGYVYTPAVSDMWIAGAIGTIMQLVEKKQGETHVGMGVWVVKGSGAGSII